MVEGANMTQQVHEELNRLRERVAELEASEADRRRAEQEIRDLAKFLSENPNPVLRIAPEVEVLYANPAACKLLFGGDTANPSHAPPRWLPVLREAMRSESPQELEEQFGERTFNFVFAPVADSGYVNIYGLDVTDSKRAEHRRRELQVQVQRARKLESLGVLAGGIAHDFNNLLAVMVGNADLAASELLEQSPAWSNLQEIKKAGLRATHLTNQMLAYSGRGRFIIKPVDLNELVRGMRHLLEASIPGWIALRYDLADDLPEIRADGSHMQQAIMNLVANATEAIGDDTGAITIRTGAMEADRSYLSRTHLADRCAEGRYVFLEVVDTGHGMDADTQARLFEPFFSTRFAGRGLGLSATLGIVRSHNGTIMVNSRVGEGTTVQLLFPCNPEKAPPLEAEIGRPVEGWTGQGVILVVDDEQGLRILARKMLESVGLTVLTADGGREAVEVFAANADRISAVLLDMTMPEMSGRETFDRLLRIRPDVPVLLCSGYAEEDASRQFGDEPLAGFLHKPFGMEEMISKIRRVLEAPAASERST